MNPIIINAAATIVATLIIKAINDN